MRVWSGPVPCWSWGCKLGRQKTLTLNPKLRGSVGEGGGAWEKSQSLVWASAMLELGV